ncbi:6688_t:CDS:1, partial [Funneliformis geosporum]
MIFCKSMQIVIVELGEATNTATTTADNSTKVEEFEYEIREALKE